MRNAAEPHIDLILRYADGQLTDAEFDTLQAALRDDASIRALFVRLLLQAGHVHEAVSDAASTALRLAQDKRAAHRHRWLALAAALLIAAGALAIYFVVLSDPQPEARDPQSSSPIASLIDATDTVVINDGLGNPGSDYPAGSYSIESGEAEFLLRSRVTVNLRGKTRLRVHSPMLATLETGSASFHCPPGSEGFTVHLPEGARVVDLGTAFHVDVDSRGHSFVKVTEGLARVESAGPPIVLAAGRSCRTNDEGVAYPLYDIAYVDATGGPKGNTFATGGSPSDTSWSFREGEPGDGASQWQERRDRGNGGQIYQAHPRSAIPELTTRITGLADGVYDVWVFFWDSNHVSGNLWTIHAGLRSGSLSRYDADGIATHAQAVRADRLGFTRPVTTSWFNGAVQLYGVFLGRTVVSDGNPIEVFIDNNVVDTGDFRTWYDGVGYRRIDAPEEPTATRISAADLPVPQSDANQSSNRNSRR